MSVVVKYLFLQASQSTQVMGCVAYGRLTHIKPQTTG
jgi:hypothetical protein